MQVYLVGGAVRDELLGLPAAERDFVVVGATVEMMLAQGFTQVGRDFPVFLHPDTHEEYALARTERKTAPGYQGFQVFASPEVTLEEDLQRRDLTINAMARSVDGTLIDPHGGQRDLSARIFRHVGPAFVEDPVRVLRLARFAAQFSNFSIAPETLGLIDRMVSAGELDALVPERVWQEFVRGLQQAQPSRMLHLLQQAQVLRKLLPELALEDPAAPMILALIDQPVSAEYTKLQTAQLRFAWLMTLCPAQGIKALGDRLRVPQDFVHLAWLCAHHRTLLIDIASSEKVETKAGLLLELLQRCDALRRPERFALCVVVWAKLGWIDAALIKRALDAAGGVNSAAIAAQVTALSEPGTNPSQLIAQAILSTRHQAIARTLNQK